MSVEYRSVIHFLWLKKKSPKEIFADMQKTYGDSCPTRYNIYYWVKQFDNGRKTVIDLPRSGRPKLFVKIKDVKKVIDLFPFASCRYIAHVINIDKNTVKRILIEDLHMKKICSHWVPHNLTQHQKNQRLNDSNNLLSLLNSFSDN